MDDVKIASKRKNNVKNTSKGRKIWQYLFDLIVKTILCTAIISINFTLFANSGSYNIFSSSMYGNIEAIYIYAGIAAISFVLIFLSSFIRPFENILLSSILGISAIAIINQFATFDKQSGLLLLFNGVFSDQINIILYEYSHLIIFIAIFLISWIILSLLNRSFLFYLTIGVCSLLGWLVSEAYLNPNIKYFNDVAGLPNFKKENMGQNFIFLSFNDLTSINNIKKLDSTKSQNTELVNKTYKNAVGFFQKNNFTLYPNALVEYSEDPLFNLVKSYNADNLKEPVENNIKEASYAESYFNFKSLQNNKIQLKNNALYNMLRKNEYKINVFQTRDVDTCYVDNKLNVSSCKEKILSPIFVNIEQFNTFDKVVILASQWLESTKLIKSTNTILKLLEYGKPFIPEEFSAKNIELGKVYSYNSPKVFDQILNTVDKLSGNQAYFAIIDLPSNNYVYDEFCKIKPLKLWTETKNNSFNSPLIKRQAAYAEQMNCLYGSLEKFIKQLEIMGEDEKTTIVIQGLNNPIDLIGKNAEFYKQIQNKQQVTFAVKHADSTKGKIDYSVCSIPEIINSIFFSKNKCSEFAILNTTEKNIETVKNAVNKSKLNQTTIDEAINSFNKWFEIWSVNNDFNDIKPTPKTENKFIDEASLMDKTINDIPESKMESISVTNDKTEDETDITESVNNDNNVDNNNTNTDTNTDTNIDTKDINIANDVDIVKNIDEIKSQTTKENNDENNKKPSKLEEIAQNTYKEINSKVNEIVQNKDKNLIDQINNTTQELSSKIDNTIKKVTDKVSETIKKLPEINNESSKDENNIDLPEKDNKQEKINEIITKTKQAIKEKEEAVYENIVSSIDKPEANEPSDEQSPELKSILEAPVADGQNLSPEELKKIYHQKIKNASTNNVYIEVIER